MTRPGSAGTVDLRLPPMHPSADFHVYVSNADSQDLHVLALDAERGALTPVQVLPLGGPVMPLVVSADRRRLHAALRAQPFRVVTLAIDGASGRLSPLGEAPLPDNTANLDLDPTGQWLFAASYQGHKISVSRIEADGRAGPIEHLLHTGRHAHAIHAAAGNRFVLSSSLGSDRLHVWRFDAATGALTPHDPPAWCSAAGAGPRHFLWNAAQTRLYLLNELDASIDVLDWDAQTGRLAPLQTVSALPPGFSGKPWASDLHLSADGRTLHASERSTSTLVSFRVDAADGRLQPLGHTPTEAVPRGFALSPDGRWLLAVGQESHHLALHPIDATTGLPGAPVQRLALGRNPNWVTVVRAG